MSLRRKLFLFVGLPTICVFVAMVVTEFFALRTVATGQAREHARLLAERTAQDLNAELVAAAAAADVMAAAMTAGDLDMRRLPSIGADMVTRLPLVEGVVFAFQIDSRVADIPLAGYTFVQDGQLAFKDIAEDFDITKSSPWYLPNLIVGEGVWTEPFKGEVFGGHLVSYTTPFVTPGGRKGFVVVDIPLEPLVLQLGVGDYEHVDNYLVSAGGHVIVQPSTDDLMATGGEGHIVERAFVSEPGWTFVAAIRDSEVYANVYSLLQRNAAIMIGGGAVIMMLLLLTTLRITRRLAHVAVGVKAVTEGDLDATVRGSGGDEIGRLAAGFNQMTSQLRATVQEAAEEVARRQAVERELEVAREIQQAMLPQDFPPFPDRREIDLYATLTPTSHVAGDFYDFWLHDDTLTVVIADVSGHGVPAALVMSQARTVLRDAHGSGETLVGMLKHVNITVGDHNSRQMFLTAVVVQLDLTTGAYQLVNAGHPSVLVVHADTTSIEGMPTGPLLGVMEDAQWEVRAGALQAGEALVLYTDGVSEAMSANGELLGTEQIAESLHASDARALCAQTVAVAEAFQDGPIRDDLTVLAVRWLGESS